MRKCLEILLAGTIAHQKCCVPLKVITVGVNILAKRFWQFQSISSVPVSKTLFSRLTDHIVPSCGQLRFLPKSTARIFNLPPHRMPSNVFIVSHFTFIVKVNFHRRLAELAPKQMFAYNDRP